jgi:predicted transcriptional regulator
VTTLAESESGSKSANAPVLGDLTEAPDIATLCWQLPATRTTLRDMDMTDLEAGHISCPETEADRQRRIAWQAERIAEARADVAAGRLVGSVKVKAWIDSINSDHELPVPYSGN